MIGTLPGLGSLYASESLLSRMLLSIYQSLQKVACDLSDLTIFQNREDARQLVKSGVVPENKTMVIAGSGVATETFSQQRVPAAARDELRSELGIQSAPAKRGRRARSRRLLVRKTGFKKAIVTLAEGQTLEIFEGVK